MSKEERDLWLKMHKEELKKLAEAGSVLKKAAEETAAENERAKLDAEKAVEKK
jgi:hypothetical protein